MSNITTELQREKKTQLDVLTGDKAIKQVFLLEQGDAAEDMRIATALGGKHSISRAQNDRGRILTLEKLDGKYKGNVFTTDQIKKLACKYNMRFLPSNLYCGNLDIEVISKLKQFSKDTGVDISTGALHFQFHILAPEKCFKLKEIIKIKRDPDPAIFYQIDDGHYRLVHQWGDDFSFVNRIAGWNWNTRVSKFLTQMAFTILFVGLVSWGLYELLPSTAAFWVTFGVGVLGLLRCLVLGFSDFNDDAEFHKEKWRSERKLVN